jgi:hypothetical protein
VRFGEKFGLDGNSLTIQHHIETNGAFSAGFHPYFRGGNKREIEIFSLEPGTAYWYLPGSLRKAEKDDVIVYDRSLTYVPGTQGSLNFAAGEVNHHYGRRVATPDTP